VELHEGFVVNGDAEGKQVSWRAMLITCLLPPKRIIPLSFLACIVLSFRIY
jgi:hypothetical protein